MIDPILSSAIFCNAASLAESGKFDCRGVFTAFFAWAYPTSVRAWHAILTAHGLPRGTNSIAVSISRSRTGKKQPLAIVEVNTGPKELGSVVNVRLFHQFDREGLYFLHFNLMRARYIIV